MCTSNFACRNDKKDLGIKPRVDRKGFEGLVQVSVVSITGAFAGDGSFRDIDTRLICLLLIRSKFGNTSFLAKITLYSSLASYIAAHQD